MATRFNVTNADVVARQIREYGARVVAQALPAALNRTAQGIRTDGTRMAAKAMGVPQRVIRASVKIEKATRARPMSAVIFAGRPIPLIQFQARQTQRGATASAYGQRRLYPSTFIASIRGGAPQVFKRVGRSRLPIKRLWGPGLANTVAKPDFLALLRRSARDRLLVELPRAVNAVRARSLGRRGG